MNEPLLYRALIVVGAVVTMALLVLAVLVVVEPRIDQGFQTDSLMVALTYLTGAFTVWKRPNQLAARRLLILGVLGVCGIALARALSLIAIHYGVVPWFWLGNALDQALEVAFGCAWVALFAVFPDGAYQRPHERWVVHASWVLVPAVPLLLLFSLPSLFFNIYEVHARQTMTSPLYVPSLASFGPLAIALYNGFALLLLLAVGLLVLRYQRFDHEQRLQITWPLLAALSFALAIPVFILSDYGLVPQVVAVVLFNATITLMPITLAIGLLRHRLFDTEVVLRKSLIYGALWLAITLGYGGVTAALGIAAGAYLPVSLAILLTIIATQLFQAPRRRLEGLADRWIFGDRLSGYQLLMRFGATLQSAFELTELAPQVAATVRAGLGVAWARVSLQSGSESEAALEPVAAAGIDLHAPATPTATAPLAHSGKPIGTIDCSPKLEGQFDAKDHELLATLGRQAALAIHNARLAAELAERLDEIQIQARELAASRTRIVQAGEEERRRIERNIHDGVQQELVALLAKIRLARNQLARDPKLAERTLAELQEDARQALNDLRELAHGIHPAILSDRGLLEAIEARIARLPIGVTIEPDGVGRGARYAEEIKGAAYFVVCEGLANVLKHAASQHTTVHLSSTANTLHVEVIDDGRGFDPEAVMPSGLRGLADRIEALGGSLNVVSRPTAGTTLIANLPLRGRCDA